MPIICSRAPCLQTRLVKRRSRKCTDVTRAQSQFEFSCRQASPCPEDFRWCPWRPAIKHKRTHPGLVPGNRLRIAHASLPCNFGPAQLANGYDISISRPAACPPQIRVFVVCLCSSSDEFNSSHLGMLTAIGTLSHHRAYLGVGGTLLLVMECSSMRAEDGHLSRDGGICRRQF